MRKLIYLVAFLSTANLITGNVEFPTLIVDGTRAEEGQFPFIVSIRVGGAHNCGGSIINKRWVLTAAHCASDEFDNDILSVVAGSLTLNGVGEDPFSVEQKIPHPQWDSRSNTNDIALIKVDRDFEFHQKRVEIIQLASANQLVPAGAPILIAGWGYTRYPKSQASNELLYINVTVVAKNDCQAQWIGQNVITKRHLCVKDLKHHSGTCLGDSGGPYIYENRIVGVHIFGDWCKLNKPSAATKVSEYLPWIENEQAKYP